MAKKKSAGKKKEKKAVKVAAAKKPAASKKKGAVLSVAVASVSKKNKKKPKKSKNGGGKAVDKNNNSNNHNQQSHFFESIFGPIRKQKGPSHDDSSNRKQKRKMAKLTLLKHPGRTSAKHEPPQKKQQPPKKKAKKKKSGTSGNNNSVSRNFFVRLPRTSDHKVPWLRNIKPPSISTYLPNRKKAAIATAAPAPAEASAKMAESSPSKNDVESSPSSSSILRLIRNIPQSELENLDNEIQSFAEYVQLSAKERRARQYVVDAVEQIVKDVVTSRRQLVDDVKCQVFGSFASQQVCTFQSDVDLAVWGVVPPDTGSNGSTRCNTHLRFNHEDSMEAPKSPMATTTPTESSDHPNRRKQAKIAKWKEALDAAVAAQAEATSDGSSKTDDVVTAESQTASQPTKNEEKPTGNAIVVDDKDDENDMEEFFVIDRVGVTTDETAVTTENSEGTSEDCPVIVDDKVSQSDDNGDINNNKSISESVAISSEEDTPTTVDNENIGKSVKGSEEGDNDDANEEEFSGGSDTGSISSGEDTADKLEGLNGAEDDDDDLVVDLAEDNDDYDVVVGSSKSDDDDESVVDLTKAAVTLESLLSLPDAEETFNGAVTDSDEQWTRIQAGAEDDDDSDDDDSDYEEEDENDEDYRSEVKRRRRTVSLCSSTTDQSDDDGLYKGTNMEVSFVSPAQSKDNSPNGQVRYYGSSVGMKKNAPSFGPTGEARTQVVKALNAIANRLRKFFSRRGKLDSPPLELCVRKHARVPIINMSTPFGYECDVALGGHNGTDTSHYAKTQSERFESFSKVVLVLKVLLSQQQLDKPFTGGLGSFKLYVLVAHHLDCHLALGGSDRPSEVLLTFLFRYGGVVHGHDKIDSLSRTRLTQYMAIECKEGFDGPEASSLVDMGGVYQIDNCVSLFEACWFRLYDSLLPNLQRNSTTSNNRRSYLMQIIDGSQLDKDRAACIKKASLWTEHCKEKQPTLFSRITSALPGAECVSEDRPNVDNNNNNAAAAATPKIKCRWLARKKRAIDQLMQQHEVPKGGGGSSSRKKRKKNKN